MNRVFRFDIRYSIFDILRFSVYLFLALLLGGCQAGAQSTTRPMADLMRGPEDTARLSLFLNLKESDGPGVRLEISALEVFADGSWLPITVGPLELNSEAIGSAQVFLGSRAVPPGHYQRLRFSVDKGLIRRDSGRYEVLSLDAFPVELDLPSALHLETDDSGSLFLTWDIEGTLERTDILKPVMTIAPQVRQLLADLVYVACPDINTVFLVRTDRNWVADSFGIKGSPTYLAVDPDPSRRRLYVLASREAAIKVVDLSSQRVIDLFHIPLTDTPTFMTISPDGKWAYVLEERSNFLSRIDLATGRSATRVRLNYRPQHAAFLAERNLLAVSLGLTQMISLLHPLELIERSRIFTGDSPQGLLVSGNQLYIAESGDHTVSIFDLAAPENQVGTPQRRAPIPGNMGESHIGASRLDVGLGPRRLLETDSFIYVSNYDGDSLSVLLPDQLGVVREIRGLGRPLEMAFDPARRQLYVGEEQAAGLAVIDSTSNELIRKIELGARPLGLTVIQ
jgi:DNA-binding beta-propeller fold protein YncE